MVLGQHFTFEFGDIKIRGALVSAGLARQAKIKRLQKIGIAEIWL
jgi:hypothetical protein